jgi:hypothetical protein
MKTKQTTIWVEIEENLCGAILCAHLPKFSNSQVTTQHIEAWKMLTKQEAFKAKEVWPESNDDSGDWWKNFSERLIRVASNRDVKTNVKVVRTFSSGLPRTVSICFYWDKPTKKQNGPILGNWTLREYAKGRKKPRILRETKMELDCLGDDLYEEVFEYGFPEGYLVECDGLGSILIFHPKDESLPHYTLTFKKTAAQP